MEHYRSYIEDYNIIVSSKIGPININLGESIYFPNGIIGLPKEKNFCLASHPLKEVSYFMILQSISNHSIRFMVLKLGLNELGYNQQFQLAEACDHLDINPNNVDVVFIVTKKQFMHKEILVANAEAPIIIDYETMTGLQIV